MTVTSRHAEAETDHGRGFILCLIKFAQHAENWLKIQEDYEYMRQSVKEQKIETPPGFLDKTGEVSRFFYGASDHLIGLEIPDNWKGTKIARKVTKLRSKCLGMRLGLPSRGIKYTRNEVKKMYDLLEEIAILIDKELGLEPDIGRY